MISITQEMKYQQWTEDINELFKTDPHAAMRMAHVCLKVDPSWTNTHEFMKLVLGPIGQWFGEHWKEVDLGSNN